MAKTKLSHRAFALSLALLFLVTSLGFSGVVIWQLTQNKNQPPTTQSTTQGGKLQGTKLKDFTPLGKVAQLQITDIKQGSGEVVKAGATVTAHYTGASALTGIIFQSSLDSGQPVSFPLSGVIKGWTQGVPGMKVGGIRRLVIPSDLAYGTAGSPPLIQPNEPLVFDIEITKVQNP